MGLAVVADGRGRVPTSDSTRTTRKRKCIPGRSMVRRPVNDNQKVVSFFTFFGKKRSGDERVYHRGRAVQRADVG